MRKMSRTSRFPVLDLEDAPGARAACGPAEPWHSSPLPSVISTLENVRRMREEGNFRCIRRPLQRWPGARLSHRPARPRRAFELHRADQRGDARKQVILAQDLGIQLRGRRGRIVACRFGHLIGDDRARLRIGQREPLARRLRASSAARSSSNRSRPFGVRCIDPSSLTGFLNRLSAPRRREESRSATATSVLRRDRPRSQGRRSRSHSRSSPPAAGCHSPRPP